MLPRQLGTDKVHHCDILGTHTLQLSFARLTNAGPLGVSRQRFRRRSMRAADGRYPYERLTALHKAHEVRVTTQYMHVHGAAHANRCMLQRKRYRAPCLAGPGPGPGQAQHSMAYRAHPRTRSMGCLSPALSM
jgi:hypothetical protein